VKPIYNEFIGREFLLQQPASELLDENDRMDRTDNS
jgi:hypothetical protein